MAFVVFSLEKLGVIPAPWQVGCYVLGVLLGTAVHYSIMFQPGDVQLLDRARPGVDLRLL